MPGLRALLFDVDGTIAETERGGHRVAYNAAFKELGLPWRWSADAYGRLLTTAGGKERLRAYIVAHAPTFAGPDLDALVSRIHERKSRLFARVAGDLALRPGVLRLVRETRTARIAVGLATTASRAAVDALLARQPDLAGTVAAIGAGDVVAAKKPDPAIYHWTLEALGARPDEALAVEDSGLGLRAARSAGVATLVTPSEYTRDDDFTGAAAVLSDLGEPEAQAQCLAGPAPLRGYVDVAYVAALLQASAGS